MDATGEDFQSWSLEIFYLFRERLIRGIRMRPLREMAKLTFISGTPSPNSAISRRSHTMSIFLTPRTWNTDHFLISNPLHFLRGFHLVFVPMSQLIEITFTPGINLTFRIYCQRMCKSCANFAPKLILPYFFKYIEIIFGFMAIESMMPSSEHFSFSWYNNWEPIPCCDLRYRKSNLSFSEFCDIFEISHSQCPILIMPSTMKHPLGINNQWMPIPSRYFIHSYFQWNFFRDWDHFRTTA